MAYITSLLSCYVTFDIINFYYVVDDIMNFLLCHLRHYGFSIMSLMALWISYYVTYDIMAFLLFHLRHNKPHIVLL